MISSSNDKTHKDSLKQLDDAHLAGMSVTSAMLPMAARASSIPTKLHCP